MNSQEARLLQSPRNSNGAFRLLGLSAVASWLDKKSLGERGGRGSSQRVGRRGQLQVFRPSAKTSPPAASLRRLHKRDFQRRPPPPARKKLYAQRWPCACLPKESLQLRLFNASKRFARAATAIRPPNKQGTVSSFPLPLEEAPVRKLSF